MRRPPVSSVFPYTTLFRSRLFPRPEGSAASEDHRRGGAALGRFRRELRVRGERRPCVLFPHERDRKSTRLNSSHQIISYAVFCLKKKKPHKDHTHQPIPRP